MGAGAGIVATTGVPANASAEVDPTGDNDTVVMSDTPAISCRARVCIGPAKRRSGEGRPRSHAHVSATSDQQRRSHAPHPSRATALMITASETVLRDREWRIPPSEGIRPGRGQPASRHSSTGTPTVSRPTSRSDRSPPAIRRGRVGRIAVMVHLARRGRPGRCRFRRWRPSASRPATGSRGPGSCEPSPRRYRRRRSRSR